MLKNFFISFFLLISNLLSSQPAISRAYAFTYGTRKNPDFNFTWAEARECNLLISVNKQKLTIYSDPIIEYYTIEDLGENSEGNSHKFQMLDNHETKCLLYVTLSDGKIYMIIEYYDFAILYLTRTSN